MLHNLQITNLCSFPQPSSIWPDLYQDFTPFTCIQGLKKQPVELFWLILAVKFDTLLMYVVKAQTCCRMRYRGHLYYNNSYI